MLSHTGDLQGTPGRMGVRLIALFVLALALAGSLAVGLAPAVHGAGASTASKNSCGAATSAKPGCGPSACKPITPADYTLPATRPRGGARATLSRTGGVTGASVTLTGSGWPADAPVELFTGAVDNQGDLEIPPGPFAQGVADAHGYVTITFQTPDTGDCLTPDGLYLAAHQALFIARTPDGKARVSQLYTFYPLPTLTVFDSWIVTSDSSLFITGAGWEPGQWVTITPAYALWPRTGNLETDPSEFQRLPLAATSVRAIYDGTLAVTVAVPPEPPEAQIVFFATASGPRNGDVSVMLPRIFSMRPEAQTTLALGHRSGVAGSTVTVSGTNWPAGQVILIEYCRGAEVALCSPGTTQGLASPRADDSGRLTATIQIPDGAMAGPITIQARPLDTPFTDPAGYLYNHSQPFMIVYPFRLAHPRVQMAINASPVAAAGLVIGLLALGEWIRKRRITGETHGPR